MNINEHERLSNFTLWLTNVKEQRFYCCSTFYRHSRVFYTTHNAHPNMGVKPPAVVRYSLLRSINAASGCICRFDGIGYINFNFRDVWAITKKTQYGWNNLTNTVISEPYIISSHYRLTNTNKNNHVAPIMWLVRQLDSLI